MKYFLTLLAVLFLLPLNAQPVDFGRYSSAFLFDNYSFNSEDLMNPGVSLRLSALLKAKYAEIQNEQAGRTLKSPNAGRVKNFLIHYDSKIEAAAGNKAYQSKLTALKKKPMPYKKLEVTSYNTIPQSEDFVKHLMVLRNKLWDRASRLKLVYPTADLPIRYRGIYADEDYSSKTLRDYYRYANQCVYRSLDLDTCSYVVSSRADNMLSIAEAALEVEDMPVFYGAMDELLKILKQRVKKASLKYIFSNAKPLGI